jgi:twitching motility protein PilT
MIASGSQEGMITMDTSILQLVQAGIISDKTALTYAANPELLAKRLNR